MLAGATGLNPSFTAPEVAADTELTFEVTVSDGAHTAKDSVNVLVKDLGGVGGSGGTAGSGGAPNGGAGGIANGGSAGDGGDGGLATGTSADGGGGYGGKDLVVTACTCTTAGDTAPSRTGALLAPLLGALALVLRRRRRSPQG